MHGIPTTQAQWLDEMKIDPKPKSAKEQNLLRRIEGLREQVRQLNRKLIAANRTVGILSGKLGRRNK